jgi:hypothetical protein
VASKEELVDGMIDIVLGELESPPSDVGRKAAIRQLTHHALHAMGNRLFGFTPAALNDSQRLDPESLEVVVRQLKASTRMSRS